MSAESRRLSPDEFRLVARLFTLSVSPPWQRFVLQLMAATGPGQGAKAAAVLWRELPAEDLQRLEATYDRFLSAAERRRL